MKKLLLLAPALLMTSLSASATVLIVNDPTIVFNGANDYTWNYDVYLGPDSRLNPPGSTCISNGVLNGVCDGLLTIYDFSGYIAGSITTTAANWTLGTVQLTGITPASLLPGDDPSILNLSWQYVGNSSVQAPQLSSLFLGTFSARSTYGIPVTTDYAGRSALGPTNLRSANLDVTQAPAVPEPATVVLLGSALLGLAISFRRKKLG